MQIVKNRVGPVLVLELEGRLDSETVDSVESVIGQCRQDAPGSLLLDFEKLDYISSAGLRVVLKSSNDIQATGYSLLLCNLKDYVQEVFEISGLINFIKICQTREEALNSILDSQSDEK